MIGDGTLMDCSNSLTLNNNYKNHIYYGEYSLKHWIELLLSRDIVLTECKRLIFRLDTGT